jgi:AcrR family transcriptional regulator
VVMSPRPAKAAAETKMRERFVEEALALIDRGGGSRGLNLREVARSVGCAHTNAYNYFEGVDELLAECLQVAFERQYEHSKRATAKTIDDPWKTVGLLVESQADFALAHPGWYLFVWIEPLRFALPSRILPLMQQATSEVVELVRVLGRRRLSVSRATQVVEDFHNHLHGVLCKAVARRVPEVPRAELRRHITSNSQRVLRTLVSGRQR